MKAFNTPALLLVIMFLAQANVLAQANSGESNTTKGPGLVTTENFAITNATIYTLTSLGTITKGTIIVSKGKILALGNEVEIPADIEVVDASGGSVTPGLINSVTHLGIEEISAIAQTVDVSTTDTRITAALKVADAFNPNSILIPQNRIHGLTRALVMPESGSGLIAGQAAVVDLSGDNNSVINDYAGLVVNLGEAGQKLAGGSRAAAMMKLREAIEDARDYAAHKNEFDRGQRRQYALSRHDLAALAPVINKEVPLIVNVHRAADIRRLLTFASAQKIDVVLAGAEEAWMVASELAAAKIAVIIDPVKNLPRRYEIIGSRADSATLLHRAGVRLLFTGQSMHNAYLVRQSAGNAVARGLSKEAALAAISKNPAEVFSIYGDYGTLKQGGVADLVLWQGDPLELTSEAQLVMIKGKKIPLVSRATRLADRYLKKIRAHQSAP